MKTMLAILLIFLLSINIDAYASDNNTIEIVWERVNIRIEPNGEVIGQFDGGEVVTWLGETRNKGDLWYHVYSPTHGKGYVKAVYAMPKGISDGKVQFKSTDGALTEQLLAYYEELQRFQFEHGYRIWLESNDFSTCNSNKVGNEVEEQIGIVLMMYKYGIIVQDTNLDILCDPSVSLAEKHSIAYNILMVHYGTDDLWYIFTAASPVGINIRPEDWHSPEVATSNDKIKLYNMVQRIEAEYR